MYRSQNLVYLLNQKLYKAKNEDKSKTWMFADPHALLDHRELFGLCCLGGSSFNILGANANNWQLGHSTHRGEGHHNNPLCNIWVAFFHNLIFSDFFMYFLLLWHNLLTLSPSHQMSFPLEEEFLLAWRPFVVWPLFSLLTLFVSSSLITASDKVSGRWLASTLPEAQRTRGSNTKFDHISSPEYWPSTNFNITTSANISISSKLKIQDIDQTWLQNLAWTSTPNLDQTLWSKVWTKV